MKIEARVSNTSSGHTVAVATDDRHQSIVILPKNGGRGSSINGGELLFAALATCFCNDLYREAAKRDIIIRGVDVEVSGMFHNAGEPAQDISYRVKVDADAPQSAIDDLIRATDSVAEIQNTVRNGCPVRLLTLMESKTLQMAESQVFNFQYPLSGARWTFCSLSSRLSAVTIMSVLLRNCSARSRSLTTTSPVGNCL